MTEESLWRTQLGSAVDDFQIVDQDMFERYSRTIVRIQESRLELV